MRPVLLLCALSACSTTKSGQRYTRNQALGLLKRLETVSLELGEFPIDGAAAVIDGDTIRVHGLESTLRLLAIDAEETFKHEDERRAFNGGWEQYKKSARGESPRPVKYPTPLGEDAKDWAQGFFDGVTSVRLERDHPGEIRDYYGRYLAYVLVKKDGSWVNYNVECVRHGFSPYFVKYGRSRRFHREFVQAQKLAQADKIGIWAPDKMHYDDYAERMKWWGDREQSITRFEKQMEERPDAYVALTRWDAMLKLEQRVGKEVTLLGAVSDIKFAERGPSLVKLSRNRGNDFDVVFWDKDVLLSSGAQYKLGEYIQVRGVVSRYRDDKRNLERLQLVVTLPGQVLAPSAELETLLEEQSLKKAGNETEGD
jgi:endonuclease YncB( thermonuclease family)